jgi:transposase InsO family protein
MGQVHHGGATTTAAVRRAIQHSQESLRVLARRHGINPKTVAKWKRRTSVQDERTGPKQPRSTVLTIDEEAVVVAFRRHTLLPLDDCLYALQATIPHLTRSSLHRCLQRHGISRLPDTDGDKPRRAKFKRYPIGFFHVDIAELRTEQGKLYLLVAIDRTSKFAFVELHEKVTRRVAGNFLRALIAAVPYRVHTVLTDNGTHFTEPSGNGWTPDEIKQMLARKQLFRAHSFEIACAKNDVEHRLTKPRHPWTNGQVERMNRTIKEATVKRFHYTTHDQLRTHLADFVAAYNFGRRLKTLRGLTPYEFVCKTWTEQPQRFTINPLHQMPGLNKGTDAAELGLPVAGHSASVARHHETGERHDQRGEKCQLDVNGEHQGEGAEKGHHRDEKVLRPVVGDLADLFQVLGDARDEVAGLLLVVEAEREFLEVVEGAPAHLRFDVDAEHVAPVGHDHHQSRVERVDEKQARGREQD